MAAPNIARKSRSPRGRSFEKGNPGGPGRPAGSRNKASIILDQMAEGDAGAILQSQIDKAKEGDQRAAEIILSRVWPARKGRPVSLDLPPISTAADVLSALGAVSSSVAAGTITPEEGQAFANVLEFKRRAIETVDLETRIKALERRK